MCIVSLVVDDVFGDDGVGVVGIVVFVYSDVRVCSTVGLCVCVCVFDCVSLCWFASVVVRLCVCVCYLYRCLFVHVIVCLRRD